MEAGRELDALIAEKVMGLTLGPAPMSANFEITCVKLGDHEWRNISYYSTKIGAAWEVVEKMRGHSDSLRRTFRIVAYPYHRTYATFDIEEDSDDWTEANGDHATPLAICLAALKAVEVAA